MESKKESIKKIRTCSHCGEKGHNKRSCPKKPIEDTEKIRNKDTIEESILISDKRESLITDLLDRQSYDIPIDFIYISYHFPTIFLYVLRCSYVFEICSCHFVQLTCTSC